MKSILVGERFNLPPERFTRLLSRYGEHGDEWFELMRRLGCLADERYCKLKSCGVTWDVGINLTTPETQDVPFDWEQGKQTAALLRSKYLAQWGITHVWLCGRAAVNCFGFRTKSMCEMWQEAGLHYFALPHPSGRSTWWNDISNRALLETTAPRFLTAVEMPSCGRY